MAISERRRELKRRRKRREKRRKQMMKPGSVRKRNPAVPVPEEPSRETGGKKGQKKEEK